MQHEQTIEFGQQALMTTLTLIAPILIVAILVGLLVGVLIIRQIKQSRQRQVVQ